MDEYGVADLGPFAPVFENWNDSAALEESVLSLCELHAQKAVDVELPDDDFIFGLNVGICCELPVEILFLRRVRQDLGMSIPDPDHPMLRSPLAQLPYPCPRSGYDECIAEIYGNCKEIMPDLLIPWEEELQAAGPGDERSVPVLDVESIA